MEIVLQKFNSVFTTDCVIFGFNEGELKVLLIERNEEPFKDWWALPGYFVKEDENVHHSAERVLFELTGLRDIFMEQFYAFGDVGRHPQGRVITLAYYAMIRLDNQVQVKPIINSAAKSAAWYSVTDMPKLAFDHQQIFDKACKKIQRKISYQPIAFELLPEKFTLTQLQQLYEAIMGKKLDKRNFRKKMLNYDVLRELGEKQKGVSYRAAKLYKFDKRKYSKLFQKELSFGK